MALNSFNAYHSYLKSIEPLNDAERGRLFTALLKYSSTGTAPELRGNERFVFPMMKEQIDRDAEKYEAKCAKNRESSAKGGAANAKRWEPNGSRTAPKDKDKDKDKNKDKDKDYPLRGNARKARRNPHCPITRFRPSFAQRSRNG